MNLKYAKMLAIVVHEKMKLVDNTLNNQKLSLVNTIITNIKLRPLLEEKALMNDFGRTVPSAEIDCWK